MTKKVGIIGASGYTALELIRRIVKHPEVELTTLTTRSEDMSHVADVHPSVRGALDLRLIPFNAAQFAEEGPGLVDPSWISLTGLGTNRRSKAAR